jgi:hypothetical protein
MGKNQEKILIPAGSMLNQGLHEDDDYYIAKKNLQAIVLEYLPGAIQVLIPELTTDFAKRFSIKNIPQQNTTFYFHRPN